MQWSLFSFRFLSLVIFSLCLNFNGAVQAQAPLVDSLISLSSLDLAHLSLAASRPLQDDHVSDYVDDYLRPLAKSAHDSRMVSGFTSLALGAGFLISGANAFTKEKRNGGNAQNGAIFVGSGTVLTVIGFHELFFRSKAEKEYASISKIEDPESRNYEASWSLEAMAHDARKARLGGSIAFAILGGVQLAIAGGQSKENDGTQVFLAGSSFAVSAICLVVKSSAERTYDRFSHEHGESFSLAVGPSFGNGTPGLRACLSF